jgi:ribulose-phosphate 3-epimerase
MEIVPALLTDKMEDLQKMLAISARFAPLVQVDFMDGVFVPSKSLSFRDMETLPLEVDCELHLMVQDPLEFISLSLHPRIRRILFHVEAVKNPEAVIQEIHARGREAGVCVNPDTGLDRFAGLIPQAETLLFLSVHPGYYGSPFIPEVLYKVKAVRKEFPDLIIGLDGGVSKENLPRIREAGVSYACVGSRIFMTPDPEESYRELLRIANQLID